MENPEEVLQALDEFQKMRPSEIPRELEEYLCWVAKTGDPIYQWSLIKPLFREKLTRVMTDFYESCPTLELAPCPNVEQFNYDIMKCNLLELLESFANAPFTVQRICELLTAPRKEYNRVDKFMRAIEKNILVVSTREPGPAARRSENGDGMVNGSADEDVSSSQPSHEVEMESWVKDCTSDAPVTMSAEETMPLLDSVITAGKVAKIARSNDEELPLVAEKSEQSALDVTNTNVPSVAGDISDTNDITVPVQNQDVAISETSVENLSANGAEMAAIIADVPEAVMNEDTSSQPSLDSEADDADSASPRKLQTTFQTKDFGKTEVKSPKFYAEEVKKDAEKSRPEEPDIGVANPLQNDETTDKSIVEPKHTFECQESVLPIVESLLEKRPRDESEITDLETGENPGDSEDIISSPAKKSCIVASEVSLKSEESTAFIAKPDEIKKAEDATQMEEATIETPAESSCTERLSSSEETKIQTEIDEESKKNLTDTTDNSLPEAERATEIESSKPIVEEPSFEEGSEDSSSKSPQRVAEQSESGITIEEAMDDDTRINKSIVPDPIPIIEEPKETEQSLQDSGNSTVIEELPIEETTESPVVTTPVEIAEPAVPIIEELPIVESSSEEVANVLPIVQEDITDVRSPTETLEKIEPAESMEVDTEESCPTFQQDEPMEQEPGDMVKS